MWLWICGAPFVPLLPVDLASMGLWILELIDWPVRSATNLCWHWYIDFKVLHRQYVVWILANKQERGNAVPFDIFLAFDGVGPTSTSLVMATNKIVSFGRLRSLTVTNQQPKLRTYRLLVGEESVVSCWLTAFGSWLVGLMTDHQQRPTLF